MNQVQGFLRKLYRGVGTARAKRLENLLARGEWALIQKERMSDPSVYQNEKAYFRDALVVEMTRKMLLPGDNVAREQAAVETFWHSERQCAETNARLSKFEDLRGPFAAADEKLITFINRWKTEVRRVLGPAPCMLTPRFSGGSTLSDQGKRVTIPDKLSSVPTFYAGGRGFNLSPYLNGTPWFLKTIDYRRGNKFFTVPKDSEKDRGCCVEASLAVSLQLDAGDIVTRRIEKAYQVDMKRLPEYHRWLSQLASIHGTFATIDLSNASDTVARVLVKILLPPDWYALLNSLRAKLTLQGEKWVWLEKFSSMGNGFTFPLETLLFRTLAAALGSRCASVFGDDIVIESERANDMLAALRFFGFTPNAKKTFCEGPFRESCGGDYFNGAPVRAHYLKEPPSEPQHWVALANGLRRVDPQGVYTRAAWHYCVDQVPSDWRVFTSESSLLDSDASNFGDLAFFDPAAKPTLRFRAWPERVTLFGKRVGDVVPMWKVKQPFSHQFKLTDHFDADTAMVAATLGCGEMVSVRKSVAGYRTGWITAFTERAPG